MLVNESAKVEISRLWSGQHWGEKKCRPKMKELKTSAAM
jgi:hypothetical protein